MEEKEREATEKLNDTKRIEREDKKGEGTTPTLQTKVKIEQEARTERVPYKGKEDS